MDNFNIKKVRAIAFYTVLSAAAIICIAEALQNLPAVMEKLKPIHAAIVSIIAPILCGFIIAYLLNPLINFFEKLFLKTKKGFFVKKERPFSVVAAFLTTILFFSTVGSLLISSVTKELQVGSLDGARIFISNFIDSLDRLYETVVEKLLSMNIQSPSFQTIAQESSDKIYGVLNNAVSDTANIFSNISSDLAIFVFGLVISVYLMLDQKRVNNLFKRVSKILFKEDTNEKLKDNLHDLNKAFSGYLRGQLLDVLFMMLAISSVLLITGCKFAIGIGILAGFGNLIPYLGPFIAYGLTIIVCLLHGDISVMWISLIALFIIQLIDGNIVAPYLLGKSISIHPLLIILFLITGGAIGGILGILLAVPIGGFITIRFKKWLKRHEEQQ